MENENKNYPDTKVYFDGSHYIGIPKDNYPHGKGCKKQSKVIPTPEQTERKAKFETAYKESRSLPKRERKKYITEKLKTEFETAEQAKKYTAQNLDRKRNNAAKRNTRLWRKIYTQRQWDYFITFTFDDKKHTEQNLAIALSRYIRYTANDRQIRNRYGLRPPKPPQANYIAKHAFCGTVRAQRFQRDMSD